MNKKIEGHEGVIYCTRKKAHDIYVFMKGHGDKPHAPEPSCEKGLYEIRYVSQNFADLRTKLRGEYGNHIRIMR